MIDAGSRGLHVEVVWTEMMLTQKSRLLAAEGGVERLHFCESRTENMRELAWLRTVQDIP